MCRRKIEPRTQATCTKKLAKIVRVVPEIYALLMGKKTPSRRYAMRSIINVEEEDRATDTGSMHKNLVNIARVVPEISSRTDTHRQTCSSQYFATAPAGEVTTASSLFTRYRPTYEVTTYQCITKYFKAMTDHRI